MIPVTLFFFSDDKIKYSEQHRQLSDLQDKDILSCQNTKEL